MTLTNESLQILQSCLLKCYISPRHSQWLVMARNNPSPLTKPTPELVGHWNKKEEHLRKLIWLHQPFYLENNSNIARNKDFYFYIHKEFWKSCRWTGWKTMLLTWNWWKFFLLQQIFKHLNRRCSNELGSALLASLGIFPPRLPLLHLFLFLRP